MTEKLYTSTLNAGLGMIEETKILLDLWHPGMSTTELQYIALTSGRFPNISARRLRNLVLESFVPNYLHHKSAPAMLLQKLQGLLSNQEFEQLLFLFTCRTHVILADFVREVYWNTYTAGRDRLGNEEARAFVIRAVQDGKTTSPWSENTIGRVASYLTRYCADFGLLERGPKQIRKILPYRIHPRVATILAYELHFAGLGDNAVLAHPDWTLFGMERADVLDEMKRLALQSWLIIQSAGGVTKISWKFQSMEALTDVLAQG